MSAAFSLNIRFYQGHGFPVRNGLSVGEVQVTLRQTQEMQGIQHICLAISVIPGDDIDLGIKRPIGRAMVLKMCEL